MVLKNLSEKNLKKLFGQPKLKKSLFDLFKRTKKRKSKGKTNKTKKKGRKSRRRSGKKK